MVEYINLINQKFNHQNFISHTSYQISEPMCKVIFNKTSPLKTGLSVGRGGSDSLHLAMLPEQVKM